MAAITAALVKELREKTDAPMMECKRALTEADGDLDRAEELLRVRLGTKAGKAASRITAEGMVAIKVSADRKLGAILELNCETDFVAKNDEFIALAGALVDLVASKNPADAAALSDLALDGSTVEGVRTALIGKIGENISIRRFERIVAQGELSHYIHGGARIGVVVDLVGGTDELGRDLAMQIAASKPRAVTAEGVAAADVERERSIAQQKAAESGKPAEIVAKMVEGSVQKYLKEVTLLGQPFVKDDKVSVEQLLKSKGARVGSFALYVVGEGLAKRENDFAAEVAAQAAAAGG